MTSGGGNVITVKKIKAAAAERTDVVDDEEAVASTAGGAAGGLAVGGVVERPVALQNGVVAGVGVRVPEAEYGREQGLLVPADGGGVRAVEHAREEHEEHGGHGNPHGGTRRAGTYVLVCLSCMADIPSAYIGNQLAWIDGSKSWSRSKPPSLCSPQRLGPLGHGPGFGAFLYPVSRLCFLLMKKRWGPFHTLRVEFFFWSRSSSDVNDI